MGSKILKENTPTSNFIKVDQSREWPLFVRPSFEYKILSWYSLLSMKWLYCTSQERHRSYSFYGQFFKQFFKEKQLLETKVKALMAELMSKFDEIEQLGQRFSDVAYKLKKSKPTLSIKNVSNHSILPSSTFPNTQPYAAQTLELIDAALNYNNG